MTKKKIVRVEEEKNHSDVKTFKPSDEDKKKATQFRIVAFIGWIIAIGLEIFGVVKLNQNQLSTTIMIVILIIMALLSIGGSLLWKKANRFDPASEANSFKFFIQNQLGMIMAILAFLPLIILVLTNEDLEKKDKGIITAVAVVALGITSVIGFDFNPVSIEQYTEESARVQELMGEELVYWTEHGNRYHLYEDCHHINTDRTKQLYEGTVPQAYKVKSIKEMCKTCENRAMKELA